MNRIMTTQSYIACRTLMLTFSAIAIFACVLPASANILLFGQFNGALSDDLVRYTLRAVSDDGTIINGIENPQIVPYLIDSGLHQVWTPITDAPTPTRQHQLNSGVLWSDTWLDYDSYWFFNNANSLTQGSDFSETNNHVGGAAVPSAGFGAPATGFGSMGTTGSPARKWFTIASGLQGTIVDFAQLVMKADEGVLVSLNVLTTDGQRIEFDDVAVGCVFDCGPSIFDRDLGEIPRGQIVMTTLQTHPLDTFEPGTWRIDAFTGPVGNPVGGATIDADSGLFSWNSAGQPLGPYSAIIGRNLFGGSPVSGTLSFDLVIPEPTGIMLLGLALVGAFGFIRRR